MLPTFIVIGAMKCGTSSLAAYLGAHPEVFVTTPKEPAFFDEQRTWRNGLSWYEDLFAGAEHAAARGEASTSYTKAPDVPGVPVRIASVVPDVRLVYLVRNPIARIISHYRHDVDKARERRPLVDALAQRPEFVSWSRYSFQLSLYFENFPREQILVVSTENLRDSRAATLERVFEFIGVDPSFQPPNIQHELNQGSGKRRLSPPHLALRSALSRTPILERTPKRLKQAVRRLAARPVAEHDSRIPPDLEADIWDQLDPDIRELRTIVGSEFNLWGHG